MTLDSIANLIDDYSDYADMGWPQTEESVREAEVRLGVQFPQSYREYLIRWGQLSFGPNEYLGLGSILNNVVVTTERIRRSRGLPLHLVVVCDHDGDEYVCMDTSSKQEDECPVVIWDSPTQAVSRTRANGFGEFLESDIRGFAL